MDFIPPTDSLLATWSTTFLAAITAAPTSYGLVAGDATAYGVLDTAFQASFALCNDPATKTMSTVATKDADRLALVGKARALAAIAQAYPAITPTLLTDAGLTVRDPLPSPIPAPTSSPVIEAYDLNESTPRLAFHDSLSGKPRAKPFGAIAMEFSIGFSAGPSIPPTTISYVKSVSRTPFTVDIDPANRGKTAFAYGRWVTRTGLTGPAGAQFIFAVPA